MKLIDLTCNKCGAQLKANADLKKCSCNYCGNEMLIDDEVIHHQIDNAFDAGYQAEIGRQQAQFKTTLQQARNAIEIGDYKTAYELYKSLLLQDTTNREAIFYTTICDYMLHIGDYRTKDKVNNYINSLGIQVMNNIGTDDFRDAFNFFSIAINTEVKILNGFIQYINKYTEAELYFIGNIIYKTTTIILDYRDMLNNNEQAEQINQLIANTVLQLRCRAKIYSRGLILDRMKTQCNQADIQRNTEVYNQISNQKKSEQLSRHPSVTNAAILQFLCFLIASINMGVDIQQMYSFILWIIDVLIFTISIRMLLTCKKEAPLDKILFKLSWILVSLNFLCTLGMLGYIFLKYH